MSRFAVIWVLIAAAFLVFVGFALHAVNYRHDYEESCKERGGVPKSLGHGVLLCFAPEVLR